MPEKNAKPKSKSFDTIAASKVIIANRKLYVDTEEGFIGWGLKKTEAVNDCSEIDDIIVFFNTGKFMITKVSEKKFVGKGIVHADVWKKGDKRTIYHVMYQDGLGGATMMKRFLRELCDPRYGIRSYTWCERFQIVVFLRSPRMASAEVVTIHLRPRPHLKRLRFDIDLGDLLIKARSAAEIALRKKSYRKSPKKKLVDLHSLPARFGLIR